MASCKRRQQQAVITCLHAPPRRRARLWRNSAISCAIMIAVLCNIIQSQLILINARTRSIIARTQRAARSRRHHRNITLRASSSARARNALALAP